MSRPNKVLNAAVPIVSVDTVLRWPRMRMLEKGR
jgi:hypothetical protein